MEIIDIFTLFKYTINTKLVTVCVSKNVHFSKQQRGDEELFICGNSTLLFQK